MNIDESEEFEFEEAIEEVDTLIVSDIHLGSEVSRSKQLLDVIKQFQFKRLILNGDVFDDLNFKRLSKSDWKFLSEKYPDIRLILRSLGSLATMMV
jgi:metallophosphoesterase superfamily enzyme